MLGDNRDNEADMVAQIMEDKETLTLIVRRMIAERNNFTDEDSEEPNTKTGRDEDDEGNRPKEVRNIDWVIKQCHEFENRFSPSKTGRFKIRQRKSLPKASIHNK
jgi:hypothetical protein